jgi:hypothetical protein
MQNSEAEDDSRHGSQNAPSRLLSLLEASTRARLLVGALVGRGTLPGSVAKTFL